MIEYDRVQAQVARDFMAAVRIANEMLSASNDEVFFDIYDRIVAARRADEQLRVQCGVMVP
jgi:hypothetical protein